jgi:hypothetical protein
VSDDEIIRQVRNKTTPDETKLPDEKILEFAADNTDASYQESVDINGTVADIWEYFSLDVNFMAHNIGLLGFSQPVVFRRVAYYRALSRKGGAEVAIDEVVRTDLYPVAAGAEHGV